MTSVTAKNIHAATNSSCSGGGGGGGGEGYVPAEPSHGATGGEGNGWQSASQLVIGCMSQLSA